MNYSFLRIAQIILGIIAIGLSIYVIANPGLALVYMIKILSIILIIIGIERILYGVSSTDSSKSSKIWSIILGIIVIGFGIFVAVYPGFTTGFLLILMAIGLSLVGISRIITGITRKEGPKWLRIFLIITGSFAIIVSILVFAFPLLGLVLLAYAISISLLIVGIDAITQGIWGRKLRLTK